MTNNPYKKTRPKSFFIKGSLIIACVCFLELIVFNYSAIRTRNLSPIELDLSKAKRDDNSLIVDNIHIDNIETISLFFSGSNLITTSTIEIKDDSSKDSFFVCNSMQVSPGSKKYNHDTVRVKCSGSLYAVKADWNKDYVLHLSQNTAKIPYEVSLERIVLNNPIQYEIHWGRFILMIAVALLVHIVSYFNLLSIKVNYVKSSHKLVYAGCALICCLVSINVYSQLQPYDSEPFIYTQELSYPFEDSIYEYRKATHSIIFDSLYHGVPYVRTENGDGILSDSVNPYDPSTRGTYRYWFDYAQYKGKIYTYFGITPTLLFYFPYYFIFGKLPSYLISGLFAAVLTILSGFLCTWVIAKRYIDSPSLVGLCLIAASVVLGSNILMLQTCTDRYYLSIATMQAFIFLVIWAGLKAISSESIRSQRLWFVICAIFCLLLVWSRPIGAVTVVAWLGPAFLGFILGNRRKERAKALNILFFIIPLLILASAAMYYNNVRFESPLDFGVKWQLTVEDCRYKQLSLDNCFEALFHFFFEGVSMNSSFPWIRGNADIANYTGRFLYTSSTNGVFTLPVTWGILFAGKSVNGDKNKEFGIITTAVIVTSMLIAILDLSLCGITERYVCDLLPGICLVSGIILLNLFSAENSSAGSALRRGVILACVLTIVAAINFTYWNHRNYIALYSPDSYLKMAKMLSFH